MSDIFTDPSDVERFNAERHWQTYQEIRADVDRTLATKTVGRNFTAMGVQIASRPRDLRLVFNFTPNYQGKISWVGKVALTDTDCRAGVVQVVQAPHPLLRCNYTVGEVRSKFGHIEPNKLIGVFSNAQVLIEGFWEVQKALHSNELLDSGDEEDWEDYLSLPSGTVVDILEPAPDSWEKYSLLMDTRDKLALSMRELLEFNDAYGSASLPNLS